MKLHSLITEAEVEARIDTTLDDLESDISALMALVKQTKPSSDHLKRLWQAHEKLGDVYDATEKARVQRS
jgi:hypothetical protein